MRHEQSLGICIGSTTLSAVQLVRDRGRKIQVERVHIRPHHGNPKQALFDLLEDWMGNGDLQLAVTGRKFRHAVGLTSLSEAEAVETALSHLNGGGKPFDAVISAGGESFMVYSLTEDGRISSVQTGNKCASGTGEFFLQQLRRIGLTVEEAVHSGRHEKPYKVSGRCSVFCKSDCTHAMNKGVPKERITAGLCEMMAGKILEIAKSVPKEKVMLVGGTAGNAVMVDYLRKEIVDLVIPPEASYFEALGAALWAFDHETATLPAVENLCHDNAESFSSLDPLGRFHDRVKFKTRERVVADEGDRCILGLDVGSTTTKAVLMRMKDDGIIADVYLRTMGDPVRAARHCYEELMHRLGSLADSIEIVGLGVTGSGRQIAGLHAMTDGIINEIIAHATAARYYDPLVDTIFEIGGQDAKYTYIKNGIPSDYAMNDACSAGTGSFLEEAAKESLGLEMDEIGDVAMRGTQPPNFNDQCAAFIGSDIKTAFQEGMEREDIVAGLVYSVCMNYINRVKGNRPVGERVFMQGGVCYNRAVPMAMAALTGKPMIVPPEPGLMGAFGVALEIKKRLSQGLMKETSFSLKRLKGRSLDFGTPFICKGGDPSCDRKCEIARIRIEGKTYPFGGACNRWYNVRLKRHTETDRWNLVRDYEDLFFPAETENRGEERSDRQTVGINKSFTVNSLYPLYHHFFNGLGLRVVLSAAPEQAGMERKGAPFCYPAEIAHGYFESLLSHEPDYLFLPHVRALHVVKGYRRNSTCPISQGEPYYLASAFRNHAVFEGIRKMKRVLAPVLDFSNGLAAVEDAFVEMAKMMGYSRREGCTSFARAVRFQDERIREGKERGRRFLEDLESEPHRNAVVIFGRPYNAFVSEANMGIPEKFASRGVPVVPFEFLPLDDEEVQDRMYWSTGQMILKGASCVQRHSQLFGCYITNFSCGPDSFLLGYFRCRMGDKPFLVLELDSHTADAGLETRIEAFMDIVSNFRARAKHGADEGAPGVRRRAFYDYGKQVVIDSQGRSYPLHHERVHLVFPSMGHDLLELTAAVFRAMGVRASALPPPDEKVLKLGRGNTTCKECLPLLLTVGTLLKYLKEQRDRQELLVYFMPSASGPCRFGQYSPFITQMMENSGVDDVALFSLEAENSYSGIGGRELTLRLWSCIVISDIMQDIYSVLLANAEGRPSAIETFRDQSQRIVAEMEKAPRFEGLKRVLADVADHLSRIPVKRSLEDTPFILLTGEIYVRHDDLSRQYLVERMAEQGFAARVSPVAEWVYYTDWCYLNNLSGNRPSLRKRTSLRLRSAWMRRYEKEIKEIMSRSGLTLGRPEDVEGIIRDVRSLINPELTGEAILTVGAAVREALTHCCGVIAIGPFGCMPNRVSEAILTRAMGRDRVRPKNGIHNRIQEIPFLAIESDGNPFPQIITAKLEVFLLQAARVHDIMMNERRFGEGGTRGIHEG